MKADVDLDQHVDLPAGAAHHPRPAARDVEVVDDEGEARAIEQREDAIGVDRVQRIGQPDVGNATLGEHLRLAELRAADADGAASDLRQREVRALVGLGVRPEALAARLRRLLHAIDVALETTLIDQHAGRAERGDLHAVSVLQGSRPAARSSHFGGQPLVYVRCAGCWN